MASFAAIEPAASEVVRAFSFSARRMASAFERLASKRPGRGSGCSRLTRMSPSSMRISFRAPISMSPTMGSSHRRTAPTSRAAAPALSLADFAAGCLRAASARSGARKLSSVKGVGFSARSEPMGTSRPTKRHSVDFMEHMSREELPSGAPIQRGRPSDRGKWAQYA